MLRVDLNADVGESFGPYSLGEDEALLRSVTSANVAAGFHAGDPTILRHTIRLARNCGVAVGAHPGFPDLVGFGRRELHVSAAEAEDLVLYQLAAVAGVAQAEGVRLRHVKPHGALYNMAVRDHLLAQAIVRAVSALDQSLTVFGPGHSALLHAGRAAGLPVAAEAFADRAYTANGSLAPRAMPGSVIHDPDTVVRRAIRMVKERVVTSLDGRDMPLDVDTICLHGDTPGAADLARTLRAALEADGIVVRAVHGEGG